jgi:hypothetical protein
MSDWESERHVNCCQGLTCKDCGGTVSVYNCNGAVMEELRSRPGLADYCLFVDYWVRCSNMDCQYNFGGGMGTDSDIQEIAPWVVKP